MRVKSSALMMSYTVEWFESVQGDFMNKSHSNFGIRVLFCFFILALYDTPQVFGLRSAPASVTAVRCLERGKYYFKHCTLYSSCRGV